MSNYNPCRANNSSNMDKHIGKYMGRYRGKKSCYWIVLALLIGGMPSIAVVEGQNIATAESFLDDVAARYSTIRDYIANINISQAGSTMRGRLSYLSPNRVRIDFSTPARQVLVADGKDLWIYIPSQNIVLQQTMRGSQSGAALAGSSGIQLLVNNYSVSYLSSPNPTPLSGSGERVVQLRLTWNSSREHFRELIVAVTNDKLIRRIVGTTARNATLQFDFTDIQINQGVPATRFDYDPPASANLYTDFLFDQ